MDNQKETNDFIKNPFLPNLFNFYSDQRELQQKVNELAANIDEETLIETMKELIERNKIKVFQQRLLGCLFLFAEEKLMKTQGFTSFETYLKEREVIKTKKATNSYQTLYVAKNWNLIEEKAKADNKDVYTLTMDDLYKIHRSLPKIVNESNNKKKQINQ